MSCGRSIPILVGCMLANAARAQTQPTTPGFSEPDPAATQASQPLVIAADRPGLGDSTQIIQPGHAGLELGYTFTYSKHDGAKAWTHALPEALIRVGICDDRLELRLGTAGYVFSRTSDSSGSSTESGFADVSPGIKVRLWDQDDRLPRVCLLASSTIGVGSRNVSERDVEPTLEAALSYALSEQLELDGSFAATYASDAGDRFIQGSASASVFYQFTQSTGGFIEYFVVGPNTKGSDAAHYLDIGMTCLLSDRVQLDASIGVGLNPEADTLFAGTGISFLF